MRKSKWLQQICVLGLAAVLAAGPAVSAVSVYASPEGVEQQPSSQAASAADDVYSQNWDGLRMDSAQKEYAQVQGSIDIPETVEVRLKLDSNENRRQIIMNNYGKGGYSWGLEVTAQNKLRYWEESISVSIFIPTSRSAPISG